MDTVHRDFTSEPRAGAFQAGPREYYPRESAQGDSSGLEFALTPPWKWKGKKILRVGTATSSTCAAKRVVIVITNFELDVPRPGLLYSTFQSYEIISLLLRSHLPNYDVASRSLREWRERRRKGAANIKPRSSAAESNVESALSLAVAALGDRGEGVGAEYPDDPEHAGTLDLGHIVLVLLFMGLTIVLKFLAPGSYIALLFNGPLQLNATNVECESLVCVFLERDDRFSVHLPLSPHLSRFQATVPVIILVSHPMPRPPRLCPRYVRLVSSPFSLLLSLDRYVI